MEQIQRVIAYIGRGAARVRARGLSDTARYATAVVGNAARGAFVDLRYGRRLSTSRLHINNGRPGFNPLMHTAYPVLDAIFRLEPVGPDDILVDVGCGDGRVINFWLSRWLRNRMIGIEIDEATATDTKRRLARYPNVTIIHGDASRSVPPDATVFYVYNSFVGEPLAAFERSLRGRPVKMLLYNYGDISAFAPEDWIIRFHRSERDACQYRVAVMTPRPLTT